MKRSALTVLTIPILFIAGSVSGTPEAEACSWESATAFSTPLVMPEDGQTAPSNTNIWITDPVENYYRTSSEPGQGPLEAEDIVLRSGDLLLDTRAQTVSARADYLTHMWILDPVEDLLEGQIVEVWIRDELVSSFISSGDELTVAPSPPVLELLDVNGEYFGGLFCGERPTIGVRVQDASQLLFLAAVGPVTELPDRPLAVGTGYTAVAVEVEPGPYALQVIAVDIAGNRSEPARLPEVTVPPLVYGCAAGGKRHGPASCFALLLVIASLGLRRRRHTPSCNSECLIH